MGIRKSTSAITRSINEKMHMAIKLVDGVICIDESLHLDTSTAIDIKLTSTPELRACGRANRTRKASDLNPKTSNNLLQTALMEKPIDFKSFVISILLVNDY